uniref:Uncharacterized protein n=1 Tax=Hyaloperonospora arabidopsidis (strain Emoy2) TaxID=559515 RepID=M4B7M5_HYAAE
MNDDDTPDPTDCFTYWTPSTASKIDRFYVPLTGPATVQWVIMIEPSDESDHQRVSLVLAHSGLNAPARRMARPVQYPIHSQHPARVQQALMTELIDRNVGTIQLRVYGMIRSFSV